MSLRSEKGQANIEFVGLLPLIVLIALACWQLVVAGQSFWLIGSSASAAARTQAIEGDKKTVLKAARSKLPDYLERQVRVTDTDEDGTVKLELDIPAVLVGGKLTTIDATAQFASQEE